MSEFARKTEIEIVFASNFNFDVQEFMNLKRIIFGAAGLLLAAPMFAATYFGGYEDLSRNSDWDYNDIVFSLSGSGLTLHTTDGAFYTNPVLGTSGNPFWNHASHDGAHYNIGDCIYGGGNCNGGVALDPNASYLASSSSPAHPANDVWFSVNGSVSTDVILHIASQNDVLGWYDQHGHSGIINTGGQTGDFTFHPTGDFELFGTSIISNHNGHTHYGDYNYSITDSDDPSHFAFFATPTPEPGSMGAMGLGLVGVGLLFRRRKSAQRKSAQQEARD